MNLKKIEKYERKINKLRSKVQELLNSENFNNLDGEANYTSIEQERWYTLHHALCVCEYMIEDIRIAKEELG